MSESPYAFYVGVDWASETHQFTVLTPERRLEAERRIEHTGRARYGAAVSVLVGDAAHLRLASVQDWDEGAVHVAVHRLRQRYREALRARIATTVEDPSQIDEEIRDLFAALSS